MNGGQSVKASLIESATDTGIGLILSLAISTLVLWSMDVTNYGEPSLVLVAVLTCVSVTRSFLVRRWFNGLTQARERNRP